MTMRAQVIEKGRLVQDADFRTLLQLERERLQLAGQQPGRTLEEHKARAPINQRGGFTSFEFDLGDARFTNPGYIEVPTKGWSIVYSLQGSAPGGALDIDFDLGGLPENVQPGAILRGLFNRFIVRRNAGSIQAGNVMLRIQREPDVEYDELARGDANGILGNPSGTGVGPAGATTQAYNSAAGNIPTAATDGLSLVGVRGFRAQVISALGSTITSGELHWWQLDTPTALWGETSFMQVYALTAVNRIWFPGDLENWVPEGRIYPEWRSGVNSAGAGAYIVRLYTWGG